MRFLQFPHGGVSASEYLEEEERRFSRQHDPDTAATHPLGNVSAKERDTRDEFLPTSESADSKKKRSRHTNPTILYETETSNVSVKEEANRDGGDTPFMQQKKWNTHEHCPW